MGPLLKELMETPNFRVTVVEESDVVEICGALKVSLFLTNLYFKQNVLKRQSQQKGAYVFTFIKSPTTKQKYFTK